MVQLREKSGGLKGREYCIILPFKDEAQTTLFKDPVLTAQ